jgi:protein TonB
VPAPPIVAAFVLARPVDGVCPVPGYPERERRRGVEGALRLRAVIAADGAVRDVTVATSSASAALDDAAAEALRRWRFEPATWGGAPVESVVFVPFSFRLTGR